VPEDRRTEHIHGAYQVEDSGRPIQAAMRTWGFEVAPGSAACRGVVCKASTAAGEDRLGSSGRQLMDSVVAPYLPVLALERLADTNVECIPETSLIEPTRDSGCSRRWGSDSRRAGLVLGSIAQQMLDLTAGSLVALRP